MLDTAEITIKAGNGGNGAILFRREKFIPRGGPWGGDGGTGGSIIFKVDGHYNTLTMFRRKREYIAENGQNGMKKLMKGHDGKDLIIPVPPGTLIKDQQGNILHDLIYENEELLIEKGGRGGLGNYHFKSSVNRTPMKATDGEVKSPIKLKLELKLIADVGIIGLPSSGKSTLLNSLTNTNVKTAEYHFTTLEPNLGVLNIDRYFPGNKKDIIMADIPGLIEDASLGKGLGHDFLKHIERTNILIHVLDGAKLLMFPPEELISDYKIIRKELELWNESLLEKHEIVVLNKIDLINDENILKSVEILFKQIGIKILFISSVTQKNTTILVSEIIKKQEIFKLELENEKGKSNITEINENGSDINSDIESNKNINQNSTNKKEESGMPSSIKSFGIDDLPNRRIIFKS